MPEGQSNSDAAEFSARKTVWVDNRVDKNVPLLEWWGDNSVFPTYEEAEEAVRQIREMIQQFEKEDEGKFGDQSAGEWRTTIITI